MFAMFPYLTFYLQNDLLVIPRWRVAFVSCQSTVPCFFVPLLIRHHSEKWPPGLFLGSGLVLTGAGLATILAVGTNSTWTTLIPGLLLTGIGIGIANPAIARIGLGTVPPERAGMASGISNTFRIGGLATGVAALGSLFEHRIASSLGPEFGTRSSNLAHLISSAGIRAAVAKAPTNPENRTTKQLSHSSQDFTLIIGINAALVGAGAVIAIVLIRARDFHRPPTPTPPAPEVEAIAVVRS